MNEPIFKCKLCGFRVVTKEVKLLHLKRDHSELLMGLASALYELE